MPLSAIFSASGLGATSKAVARSINSVLDQVLQAHGEVLHPLFLADADGVGQLLVLLFEDQLADRRR